MNKAIFINKLKAKTNLSNAQLEAISDLYSACFESQCAANASKQQGTLSRCEIKRRADEERAKRSKRFSNKSCAEKGEKYDEFADAQYRINELKMEQKNAVMEGDYERAEELSEQIRELETSWQKLTPVAANFRDDCTQRTQSGELKEYRGKSAQMPSEIRSVIKDMD